MEYQVTANHIKQACERTQVALIVATSKPAPRGSEGGGGAVTPPLPLPVGIISAKRELRDILLLWVDLVSDGMDVVANCDPTDASMLTWLAGSERAEYLAAHDAAGDFLDELTTVTKSLENPYLPTIPRKYIGNFGGGDVYVRDGQTDVTLADGTVETVATLEAWGRFKLLQAEGTAEEIAATIFKYYSKYITPREIADARNDDSKAACKREHKLTHVKKDGRKYIYRLQDVLDRFPRKEIITRT